MPSIATVAHLAENRQRLLVVAARLFWLAQAVDQFAQVVERRALHRTVAHLAKDDERLLVVSARLLWLAESVG